jgi:hypothetical protein
MFTHYNFCNIFGKFFIAMVVQKHSIRSIIESKKDIMGEISSVQLNPPRAQINIQAMTKILSSFKTLKWVDETLKADKENPSVPTALILCYHT